MVLSTFRYLMLPLSPQWCKKKKEYAVHLLLSTLIYGRVFNINCSSG